MNIQYTTLSERGRRPVNEDAFRVSYTPDSERWMGIVCDGMGGHAMGEMASEMVIAKIIDYWGQHMDEQDSEDKVLKACKKASVAMDEKATLLHHCEMGTTMAMVSIEGNTATMAHIGDSRCYLIRKDENGKAQVVYQSQDHHKAGGVLISRCFFSYKPEIAVPDVAQFEVKTGDRILICSDGLYSCVYPHILVERMMDDKSPEDILDVFDFLCERSGDDNYTAILAKIC